MDWSAAREPLVVTRAAHLAATALLVGSMIFDGFVARPALRRHVIAFRARKDTATWVYLILAVISGGFWLLQQTASMSGLPFNEALTADVLSTVVSETQFGEVATIRACLAICVAICLVYHRAAAAHWLGLTAAVAFAGSLAWTGHAGATAGLKGYLHLLADVLHLVATVAWIGGLASLINFLRTSEVQQKMRLCCEAVDRFSTLGFACVTVLMFTGLINFAILVGSLRALVATDYGRILTLKLTIFAVMLVLAATNRFYLKRRLASDQFAQRSNAQRHLINNCLIELILGLCVLYIVGILGTLHPAIHLGFA